MIKGSGELPISNFDTKRTSGSNHKKNNKHIGESQSQSSIKVESMPTEKPMNIKIESVATEKPVKQFSQHKDIKTDLGKLNKQSSIEVSFTGRDQSGNKYTTVTHR